MLDLFVTFGVKGSLAKIPPNKFLTFTRVYIEAHSNSNCFLLGPAVMCFTKPKFFIALICGPYKPVLVLVLIKFGPLQYAPINSRDY